LGHNDLLKTLNGMNMKPLLTSLELQALERLREKKKMYWRDTPWDFTGALNRLVKKGYAVRCGDNGRLGNNTYWVKADEAENN
jgi:hypothetical protein